MESLEEGRCTFVGCVKIVGVKSKYKFEPYTACMCMQCVDSLVFEILIHMHACIRQVWVIIF